MTRSFEWERDIGGQTPGDIIDACGSLDAAELWANDWERHGYLEVFGCDPPEGTADAIIAELRRWPLDGEDTARAEGLACGLEAVQAAGPDPWDADGNSLLPEGPLPADWEAFEDGYKAGLGDRPCPTERCDFCGADIPIASYRSDTPDVDDDEGWEEHAREHAPGCDWIVTRGHELLAITMTSDGKTVTADVAKCDRCGRWGLESVWPDGGYPGDGRLRRAIVCVSQDGGTYCCDCDPLEGGV